MLDYSKEKLEEIYREHHKNIMTSPNEEWDLYDENRKPLGRTHLRKDPLKDGDYHMVVFGFVCNSKGEFLITKRSPNKGFAGCWEITGGSATKGEDSLTAVVREIKEETGICVDPSKGKLILTHWGDHFFSDCWFFESDFTLDDVKLQEGETCDAALATAEKIIEMEKDESFVPFSYIKEVFTEIWGRS